MRFDVCVIGGCGHAGLPLAIAFAVRRQRVAIVDTNAAATAQVRAGVMPFMEEDGADMLRQALSTKHLAVVDGPEAVAESEAVVLAVSTPVDHRMGPSLRNIEQVLEAYKPFFRDDQLLILRSTLYPGTSKRVHRWMREANLNVHVAVCPERIVQGFALRELPGLPQIIAAFSPQGVERATRLFSLLTDDVVVLEPGEAELAKLFANAWRYIKFAVANQFFMIARECGTDFDRLYEGLTHNYPRAADLPRPGFTAGPCLFKDTMQLAAFANNHFFLGHSAMLVNEGLPQFVVTRVQERYDLAAMTVGILGMAFKADTDDTRDSLSFKLRDLLEMEARHVVCSDPYAKQPGLISIEQLMRQADLIVIATPHRCYRSLDFGDTPVIDIWNVRQKGTTL